MICPKCSNTSIAELSGKYLCLDCHWCWGDGVIMWKWYDVHEKAYKSEWTVTKAKPEFLYYKESWFRRLWNKIIHICG